MKFLLLVIVLVLFIYLIRKRKKSIQEDKFPPEEVHDLLLEHISFYKKLSSEQQQAFLKRVQDFLFKIRITPVKGLQLTNKDRIYVAASAIIPIFHFPDWRYNNLNEVLIYNDTFDHDYSTTAEGRNIAGMVGSGAMNRMMILSLNALKAGFEQNGVHNTGIHEFVHLLDKADGSTDGIPEYMIPKQLLDPWTRYMHGSINEIRTGHSDIDPYAGTNEAEFFAVISEYFFQKPHLLEEHHPELFYILKKVYDPQQS